MRLHTQGALREKQIDDLLSESSDLVDAILERAIRLSEKYAKDGLPLIDPETIFKAMMNIAESELS